jgi:tRNA(fMet)-specific endonuclease VapC
VKYLLDTDMVIYYLQGHPRVVEHVETTRPRDRFVCLITIGEIYHGIYHSVRVQKNLNRYRTFFKQVKTFPLTHDVAEQFGRIKANLQARGELIEDHDIWIASHALVHKAVLVTNNENHFRRIEGIHLDNWLN